MSDLSITSNARTFIVSAKPGETVTILKLVRAHEMMAFELIMPAEEDCDDLTWTEVLYLTADESVTLEDAERHGSRAAIADRIANMINEGWKINTPPTH